MKRLLIIDSHSLIHRAYHALPQLITKKGELVNAVYGFLLVFFRVIKDFNPDYIVACFDLPGPTFRHKEFKDYKATRPKTPEGLSSQIPKAKKVLHAFNVPIFEKQGFEADDLIGTVAKMVNSQQRAMNNEKVESIILSGDLDLLQLVDKNTKVYALRRGVKDAVLYDEEKVLKRYGLLPSLLPDYKALVGDASDNIAGVPGIGPKTATKLLQEFGTLENLYDKIQTLNDKYCKVQIPNNLKKKLLENKEQAFLSKKLTILQKNVPVNFDLNQSGWKDYDKEQTINIFKEFEFQSLINRLPITKADLLIDEPIKRSGRLF